MFYLQTSMSADVFRVSMKDRVAIRMARTTARANQDSLAKIAKRVGLRYLRLTFSKSVDI